MNWKPWLYGLFSAFMGGGASAVFGLPPVYANLATGLYRSTLEKHGIELRGEDLVMMGLTYGFALGRDFGRSESLTKLVEGAMASE